VTGDGTRRPAGRGASAPPPAARILFGERLDLAQRYAGWLAGEGTSRGLIGPREVPRLWERHLLNSAVLCDLVPSGARVVDVGSGAGLPGLPMAIRRPDLRVDLVEPMQRRVDFLNEVVADLELPGAVRVIRGRAEDPVVRAEVGGADWVVVRAVAPLDRLVRWCLPLLSERGTLLALKGERAADEVARHRAAIRRSGVRTIEVRQLCAVPDAPPESSERTWVVVASRGDGFACGVEEGA
jgi:16S rRNA (guanine527-N7)-methyltransferase